MRSSFPIPADPPPWFEPGARVDLGWGQVVVGDRLGDGGMGVVYRGWLYFPPDSPHPHTVPVPAAIKVLHQTLTGRSSVRQLFLGEAAALRALLHPNIVRFFGLKEGRAGQLAIIMELVDGEPLSEVIDRHVKRASPGDLPCLPFLRAWHYFQQLLGALAATHELGIIHRDVKPQNVIIRRDGFVKLTDFGIARLPEVSVKLTGSMQPGTGAYMSPEQVRGDHLDRRSDLYSAAIVLYEMITGRTPFEGDRRSELMIRSAQIEQLPAPVTELVPSAPPIIDDLFTRALAKDPGDRFSTAIELGNAFRSALHLPDSRGWQAQQTLAHFAPQIAPDSTTLGRAPTVPVAIAEAERLREAVSGAYESDH